MSKGGSIKRVRKMWRKLTRRLTPRSKGHLLLAAAVSIIALGVLIERENVNADYSDLLSVIAEGESKGNYNAYFGHANNQDIVFTSMTVAEVLRWQKEFVEQGSPSSAVGKYQFIQPTLEGLVQEMRISKKTIFDETLQDKLAIRLLERRGVHDYLRNRISKEQFAHSLSKEWAALPKVLGDNPPASYYAGDGLNASRISIAAILAAIDSLRTSSAI